MLRVYINKELKRAVIQRDDDTLTAEEIREHKDEVDAAMLQELLTWAKHNCFSREARRNGRNIIDCRWVIKWKWEHAAVSVEGSREAETKARRVI